ncbi:MAG: hypothetical protein N2Z22_03785 [Turneriella sp.]|nr:hypothetical protein [Leptospiraceae bacterium]MCX7632437.1 hypothetical protein [Turneriella sp.]
MLGLEDGKFIFGVYGMANYFIRERLALGGRIYALFPENLQYYTVGATIQYFIGPVVLNTLIVPGFTFARLFVRGEVTSDGHSYAPMVGFIWRSGGNFYYGISYNRTTYVYGGLSVTRTEFLPIFFYTF